ncbi:MAG: EcsC family protein [Clostridia bacterium]|nr:EcsC family protein [Clostridia bacterium]
MDYYEEKALQQMKIWQKEMEKAPSLASTFTKGMQVKINKLIPETAHKVVTEAIKNMVKAVLFGSELVTKEPLLYATLRDRENLLKDKISFYKKTAAASGAWTGSGGIFLGMADFPILLSLKLKFLFDAASIYGFDVGNYKERLYILYIFQLAFSSQQRRREVYFQMLDWHNYASRLPDDMSSFDWRTFQQEYRDYIDIAKMLQLVPIIGAVVGAYANYQLMDKLGETSKNAYRLRLLPQK